MVKRILLVPRSCFLVLIQCQIWYFIIKVELILCDLTRDYPLSFQGCNKTFQFQLFRQQWYFRNGDKITSWGWAVPSSVSGTDLEIKKHLGILVPSKIFLLWIYCWWVLIRVLRTIQEGEHRGTTCHSTATQMSLLPRVSGIFT